MSMVSIHVAEGTRVSDVDVDILKPMDPLLIDGGLTLITGPSGSGKSTIANLIHGRIKPTSGSVHHCNPQGETLFINEPPSRPVGLHRIFNRLAFESATDRAAAEYRKRHLGYIAQLPHMPLGITGDQYVQLVNAAIGANPDRVWVNELYSRLEITDHARKRRDQLSGGEAQRFAIALALARRPDFVVADEPTSALDSISSRHTMEIFRDITLGGVGLTSMSILMVSHDPEAIEYADRVIAMRDGEIVDDVQVAVR